MALNYDWIDTPLGTLLAVLKEGALSELNFVDDGRAANELARLHALGATADQARLSEVATQLHDYFSGQRQSFALTCAPEGSTFQQRVWRQLLAIPYGATASYGELARAISSSPRAVGRANATNPIAIIVPCHRVIGNDGSLTGYAGGVERKATLLRLEGIRYLAGYGSGVLAYDLSRFAQRTVESRNPLPPRPL